MCSAAVGLGYHVDDREAEARPPACARGIGAAEALERLLKELRREALAAIDDVQLDATVTPSRLQQDRSAAVAKRILDEIAERLLGPQAVGGDLERGVGVDRELPVRCSRPLLVALAHRREQRRGRNALAADWQLAGVAPREHEQVLGQPRQAFGLVGGRAHGVLKLRCRAWASERELELGAEGRERRPQLVARV